MNELHWRWRHKPYWLYIRYCIATGNNPKPGRFRVISPFAFK